MAFSADGKTVLTGSMDGSARLWEVAFQPLEGTVERVVLWIQLITGMEVDPSGAVHVFDPETWRQRSQRLEDLGGPPVR